MINDSKKNACQDAIDNVSDKVKAALFVMSMICGAVASSSAMNTEVSNGLTEKKEPYTTEEYANACQTMSPDNAMLKLYDKSTNDMLIARGRIIEQSVSLVAKVCQAIMKAQAPDCDNYVAARNLLNFLSLKPEHRTACLHLDPEAAVALICGKPLRDLVRTGYYKKASDTLRNIMAGAELAKSPVQSTVRSLIQKVEDAKLGAKSACFYYDLSVSYVATFGSSIYNMLIAGEMDEVNAFIDKQGIDADDLISDAHARGYQYFEKGAPGNGVSLLDEDDAAFFDSAPCMR